MQVAYVRICDPHMRTYVGHICAHMQVKYVPIFVQNWKNDKMNAILVIIDENDTFLFKDFGQNSPWKKKAGTYGKTCFEASFPVSPNFFLLQLKLISHEASVENTDK